MDEADDIWNRATEFDRTHRLPGDIALASVLSFHGLAMNGGVLDAVEQQSAASLAAARAGYTWLGLDAVVRILDDVRSAVDAGPMGDEQAERLELSADASYYAVIPTDAALESAFRARLAAEPDAFAPA